MSSLLPTSAHGASTGAELVTGDGRALPLVATTLRTEAAGGLARHVLEQTFRNPHAETLHVVYRMPLPADGAVSGYAFEIGGRVITGVVDLKREARERFERAIASGHTAALLEQERADIFTQQLGNIPAGETVVARITVDQRLAWLPEGEWELRFPTVIGPRYCGTAETVADVRATHVKVTDRSLPVTVQLQLAISDAITGGRAASSPSHALARGDDGVLALAAGARLDRDLVVRWPVATPDVGLSVATARPAHGDAYGVLTIVPPARAANRTPVARDLIVLLDTSGSMGGGPLDKAKQVVAMMIDSLAERDRFELIEFSTKPRRYTTEPQAATAKAKQDAIKWVRSRSANGGTEMRAAVTEALCTLRIGAQRQVLIVTDGYVGGEHQILQVLHDRLPRSCRLHVLGVGSAVNRSLATALARAGRGAEVIVGIDEDAERAAKRLLDRTRAPMLTNVEIMGSALVRTAPEHTPDVFAGAPLVAAVALRPEGGELIVRGELADEGWEQRIKIAAVSAGAGNQAIVALFGRERVADLEARTMLEDATHEIGVIGLEFQISTRFTSWIAVDETRVVNRGPARTDVVPQELPYGTRAAAFGLRGATSMVAEDGFAAPMMMSESSPMDLEVMRSIGGGGGPLFNDLEADDEAGEEPQASGRFARQASTRAGGSPPAPGAPPAQSKPPARPKPLAAARPMGMAPGAPPPRRMQDEAKETKAEKTKAEAEVRSRRDTEESFARDDRAEASSPARAMHEAPAEQAPPRSSVAAPEPASTASSVEPSVEPGAAKRTPWPAWAQALAPWLMLAMLAVLIALLIRWLAG